MELNKRKLLEQSDVDQEMLFQVIRQKKVALEERMETIKTQLMVGDFKLYSKSSEYVYCPPQTRVSVSIRRQRKAS